MRKTLRLVWAYSHASPEPAKPMVLRSLLLNTPYRTRIAPISFTRKIDFVHIVPHIQDIISTGRRCPICSLIADIDQFPLQNITIPSKIKTRSGKPSADTRTGDGYSVKSAVGFGTFRFQSILPEVALYIVRENIVFKILPYVVRCNAPSCRTGIVNALSRTVAPQRIILRSEPIGRISNRIIEREWSFNYIVQGHRARYLTEAVGGVFNQPDFAVRSVNRNGNRRGCTYSVPLGERVFASPLVSQTESERRFRIIRLRSEEHTSELQSPT